MLVRFSRIPIRSFIFEAMSDTHEFETSAVKFQLQPATVVSRFNVIIFIIDSSNNVNG